MKLIRLVIEPRSYSELQRALDISDPAIQRHLRDLTEAGLIEKDKESGLWKLTDKGLEYYNLMQRTEALQSSSSIESDTNETYTEKYKEEVIEAADNIVKVLRSSHPPLSRMSNVKLKGVTSTWMHVPLVSDLLARFGEKEAPFYQFITAAYIRSLRLYGPKGLKFKADFFNHIRHNFLRDLIKTKYPDSIPEADLDSLRFQATIEFNPSAAFDEALAELDLDTKQREEFIQRKHEIIKEIVRRLYYIKVQGDSEQPKPADP
ncbi:MAG: ArsR family transcriptional regulator [Nitrososphaerota archaeon]|nr:ArsR family transcriptional regulator [Nitrososphaerota archaeon]